MTYRRARLTARDMCLYVKILQVFYGKRNRDRLFLHMSQFLVGNSFPLSLIRRRVTVIPRSVAEMKTALGDRSWASFWGHENTAAIASSILCADIRPASIRPSILVNQSGYPVLDGVPYDECWILSPIYVEGYRPAISEEVSAQSIRGWHTLQLMWEDEH